MVRTCKNYARKSIRICWNYKKGLLSLEEHSHEGFPLNCNKSLPLLTKQSYQIFNSLCDIAAEEISIKEARVREINDNNQVCLDMCFERIEERLKATTTTARSSYNTFPNCLKKSKRE